MDNDNGFYRIMRFTFGACGVLLVLLLALFVITSQTTGQSLFAPEIVELVVTLFNMSVGVFMALGLFMFIMAVSTKKKNPSVPGSMVVKDGSLKYEYTDESGRKKRKTFDLKNIERFLNERGEMNIELFPIQPSPARTARLRSSTGDESTQIRKGKSSPVSLRIFSASCSAMALMAS